MVTMNAGVQNADGSLTADMGFGILGHQYSGNNPTASMMLERSQAPLGQPGANLHMVGERQRPLDNPGLNVRQYSFAGIYAAPPEPMWNQPVRSNLLDQHTTKQRLQVQWVGLSLNNRPSQPMEVWPHHQV